MHEQRNDNTPLTLVHLQALKYKEKMLLSPLAGTGVNRCTNKGTITRH
jgi:hypothetical protein